ncbi:acyl-CoA dehydrogenase family protein [Streptomyces sp. NPDC059866]|uniref:acyl-CoA dehydrogenase family protein n=1 Tax=Streptomyces sp. NPDC059866 TaxID=3346978 RepID=UPI00366819B2
MSTDRTTDTTTHPRPDDLDLLHSDVEEELRTQLRGLLRDRCGADGLLARVETDEVHDTALWQALTQELGIAGLSVPEELGGAGATWRETALVLEELGRAVAPVPYLGSSVLATAALLAAGDTRIVKDVAAGHRVAALAVPFVTAPDGELPGSVRAGDGTVRGMVRGVADALAADVLLVPAAGPDGVRRLQAVDVAAAGRSLRRNPVTSLDLTRPLADIHLWDAPCATVAVGPAAERAVRQALVAGAALLASEQLGVADWCLSTTVAYVKERHQFARPIGSFQAVKHRLADMWVLVTQARAVARNAAVALAAGSATAPTEAALAQAFLSEAVVQVAEEALQLHGGIGFTWEHPMHLYLKRAKSTALALGTADRHRVGLAGLVDLPPAAGWPTA